jgi:ATP/maltotriose-dependent transcriptional regulator MalT
MRARGRLAGLSERLLSGPGAPFPGVAALLPMISMYAGDADLAEKLMNRALAEPDPWLHAALQASLASYGENNGDAELMREAADTAYTEFSALGDRWGLATSLLVRARLSTLDGQLAEATLQYEEAAGYIASLESNEDDAYVRIRLADIRARSGDLDAAVAEIHRLQAGTGGLPMAVTDLFAGASMSSLEWQRGDESAALDRARRLRDQLRTTEPSALSGHMTAIVLGTTGGLEARLGDVGTAERDLAEAYTAAVGTADMPILASVGLAVCALAVRRLRFGDAALILGASAQVRGAEDESDAWVLVLRPELIDALGAAYQGCYGRGRSLSRPDAIARLDPARLADET